MNSREEFLIYLMPFVNIPYIWGGDDPRVGLDCSGLVQLALRPLGLDPEGDQTAQGLYNHFSEQDWIDDQIRTDMGDLVFYGKDPKNITHVEICIGKGKVIGARGGGPKVTDQKTAYHIGAKVKVCSLSSRSDIVAIIRPKGLPWG